MNHIFPKSLPKKITKLVWIIKSKKEAKSKFLKMSIQYGIGIYNNLKKNRNKKRKKQTLKCNNKYNF